MSVLRWPIIGYGVTIDDISRYININKVGYELQRLLPNDNININENLLESDLFNGDPYCYFAEFLCDLTDTKWFNYDTDGEGREFFFYPATYPWQRQDNEPKSEEDVDKEIVAILNKVCDLPDNETYPIEYIEETGWG